MSVINRHISPLHFKFSYGYILILPIYGQMQPSCFDFGYTYYTNKLEFIKKEPD